MKPSFAVIAFLISMFMGGCTNEVEPSRYQVVDSSAWPFSAGGEKTYWLDNERILFTSNRKLAPGGGALALTVWTPSNGQVISSHLTKNLICTEGEYVFFVSEDKATGERVFYRGPIEKPETNPPPSPDMSWETRFSCNWSVPNDRANIPYKIKLKDHNYLEITKAETYSIRQEIQHGEVQYYEQDGMKPVALPIYTEPAGSYDIEYNSRKNAYFISPGEYFPSDPYYHSMWWMQRDGTLTKVSFPQNLPWPSRGGLSIYPLRDGYLASYHGGGTSSLTDPGARGLYFIKEDRIESVLSGVIKGVSISPDGCRAAFVHARNDREYISKEKPHRTVKTINFCGN